MDRFRSGTASPWRAWPLLLVGILVGSLALTPAVTAAGKFIKKKKAVKLFEKKKHARAQYAGAAVRQVRMASAGDPDDAFIGSIQDGTVLSTQITAPGPGFLVVDASSEVSSGAHDSSSCGILVDGATITTSIRDVFVTPENPIAVCATHATQPVGEGVHAVELRGFDVGSAGGSTTYGPASMHVLFVALGADGELGA